MNGKLHKGTYDLKVKVTNKNKYLDGSYRIELDVNFFTSGQKDFEHLEIWRSETGELSISSTPF